MAISKGEDEGSASLGVGACCVDSAVLLRLDLDLDDGNVGRSMLAKEVFVLDVFNAVGSSYSIPLVVGRRVAIEEVDRMGDGVRSDAGHLWLRARPMVAHHHWDLASAVKRWNCSTVGSDVVLFHIWVAADLSSLAAWPGRRRLLRWPWW